MVPTTENDRRNLQQTILERPSLPDHDRRKDQGMHSVQPMESDGPSELLMGDDTVLFDPDGDMERNPPDQEFKQILESGAVASQGRIPEDPNNWLTSEPERKGGDDDPEDRGDSLPDILDGDKH